MVDSFSPPGANYRIDRRVAGIYNYRLDGMGDLLCRAKGSKVFDVGCNRGLVGYDFALNGARLVHGVDIYEDGVKTARELFADLRGCENRFEVADLTYGPKAISIFDGMRYDITLMLATYHKLKRIMKPADLSALIEHLGAITVGFFGWRGTSDKHDENDAEMTDLDRDLGMAGMVRVQTSYISAELGVAAIWARA
jgi:SAM-dependent methyltransferase